VRALAAASKVEHGLVTRFFGTFNRFFDRITDRYVHTAAFFTRRTGVALVFLVLFGGIALFFGRKVPTSFLPDEDQGFFYINLQLPNAASIQRTDEICRKVESILAQTPGVESSFWKTAPAAIPIFCQPTLPHS